MMLEKYTALRDVLLKREDVHRGSLQLVNARYSVAEAARTLTQLQPGVWLEKSAAALLSIWLNAPQSAGAVVCVSGYRTRAEQESIYNDSLAENGAEFTARYVALPGHSEHETGLAIDLALQQESIDFLRPDFPYDGICGELRSIAPQFGWVERYPEGREAATGIAHEPWHFRYVGYPHSRIMADNGLVLEEYTEFLKGYTQRRPYRFQRASLYAEVFYVPGATRVLSVPDTALVQFSGNNVDGYVCTQWG